ncbi:MXD [Mytilus coruscus]|uniref:MXD n=1 Tax=Mytilus coruscus TaxID=42192 RepID=A0A6J8ECT6_MYTCO|nr:MXD [Mytilus coruscus]
MARNHLDLTDVLMICQICSLSDALFNFNTLSARRLAQVVGKIISMSPVIGNISRLKTRYSYICIENRVSWDTVLNMEIPVQVKEELLFWLDNIKRVNVKKLDFYSKSTSGRWKALPKNSFNSHLSQLSVKLPQFCLLSRSENTMKNYKYAFETWTKCQWDFGTVDQNYRNISSHKDTRENRIIWFKQCLERLKELKVKTVGLPAHISCGLGGGDWTAYFQVTAVYIHTNTSFNIISRSSAAEHIHCKNI